MILNKLNSWPCFSEEEGDLVKKVLLSNKVNYWTGEECRNFEKEFAAYLNCGYAVALANGTVALDLALNVLDVKEGDEVIVTPRTFLASASCIVNAGAIPVFADVDMVSQNITAKSINEVLTPKTKAVICVHHAGWPCDMDPIIELAKENNLFIIEDCAQAHGAKYKDKFVGTFGDVAAWSFCQDKIMTTGGEGGMLTTNNKSLWEKAWSYKDHGKSFDAVYNQNHPPGFRWFHNDFGTNWRMLEMQGALGRLQLKKLDSWINKRRENAAFFNKELMKLDGIRLTIPEETIYHSYYRYYFFIKNDKLKKGWDRDQIMVELNKEGIPCQTGGCAEVYLEKAFSNNNLEVKTRLNNAKIIGETSLMFLVHPTLEKSELSMIIDSFKKLYSKAFQV